MTQPKDGSLGGGSAWTFNDSIAAASLRSLSSQARALLSDFAPADDRDEVVYISTPITTGPRLLRWLERNKLDGASQGERDGIDRVRNEVVAENLSQLEPLRTAIRSQFGGAHVIDPTVLDVPGWSQWEYHRFWVEIIGLYVDRIVFADGWELSTGCTIEYATALEYSLPMQDASGRPLDLTGTAARLYSAAERLQAAGRDPSVAVDAAKRSDWYADNGMKDSRLAQLATQHNVAAFVSFTPGVPRVRHLLVPGAGGSRAAGSQRALELVLNGSTEGSVNVRSFRPGADKGNPFHYGLTELSEVWSLVESLASRGYFCIVNETVDIHDGGVSGVTLGGVAEFSPDDTPRAVESADSARMPIWMAQQILRTVYGEGVTLPCHPGKRIEFSIHPHRVGYRREPVIVWEEEQVEPIPLQANVTWPNRFSHLLGDKTFGLLVADALGLPVPTSTVISRRVAPFTFGSSPRSGEWWMRTAPARQAPGHFPTTRGWSDPFEILAKEDPGGAVAAVIAQEGVSAVYSGATVPLATGEHHIEGVRGTGDSFMLGQESVIVLPAQLERQVTELLKEIESRLNGAVRIEWAADAKEIWVLQMHRVEQSIDVGIFSPGEAEEWLEFDPALGLEALGELIARALKVGAGIEVTAPIGLTSHVGDLLRKAGVPGRLAV